MPITNLLTEFLSSDSYNHFVLAIRLVGNILASSNSDYCQNFYKNSLLENLVIGWQKYQLPEVDKECSWILGNVIASNNLIMTKAVINNQYFCQKFQEILQNVHATHQVDTRAHSFYVSGCKELMIMIKNVVLAYSLELTHQLINNLNLLPHLICFLNPDRLFF
jgi:hypothetical protein